MNPPIREEAIVAFAPVLFVFCLCMVAIVYFYFRSRERQMLIERNASPEEVAAFFNKPKKEKTNTVLLFRLGIIAIFFGIALGLGIMFDEQYHMPFMVPMLLFTLTGLGLIVAHKLGLKEEEKLAERKTDNGTQMQQQMFK